MSILHGKNIVLPSEGSDVMKAVEAFLVDLNVLVFSKGAAELSLEYLDEQNVDVLFLDFINEASEAISLLKNLQEKDETRNLIILAVIGNQMDNSVSDLLSAGAADYVLATESPDQVLLKVTTLLGQPDRFSGAHMIDITPEEVHVTRENISVFVVEDDSLLRNLLRNKLEQSHFTFDFSGDGLNVCELVIAAKSNIVILDLMLPGVSGLDILAQLKENDSTKDIPVIIFSNRDEQSDRHRANELGAVGFYVKAMTDLSDLMEIIESKAN